MKHKSFELQNFKALSGDDNEPGNFEALVAVFNNIDAADEVIAPGAFAEILSTKSTFPVVWSHQWTLPPIGVTTSARETSEGLVVKGRLFISDDDSNETARAVYAAMRQGALKEWSVGLNVKAERFEERDGRQVSVFEALDLIELGPCLKGVNPETRTVEVKSDQIVQAIEASAHEDHQVPTGNHQEPLPTPEQKRQIAALFFE